MFCRRLGTQVSSRPFGHAGWWRHEFAGVARRKHFPWRRRLHGLIKTPWAQCALLLFLCSDVLSNATAHHRERRNQHPKPPAATHRRKRKRDRDKEKSDAHKRTSERVVHARLFPSPAATPAKIVVFALGQRQLPRKCIRHQTDIRATGAAIACAVQVLGCTFRTKHSGLRSVAWTLGCASHEATD